MDEKTEELREVFLDVAGEETVTESQEESRGSIAVDDEEIEDRLRSTIDSMADRYDLAEGFEKADLVEIVRLFYAGEDDDAIARELADVDEGLDDVDARDVGRARVDLHLVTEADRDGPVGLEELRDRLDSGGSIDEVAAEHGVSESVLERQRRVAEVEAERRLIGDRFRREFEHVLGDRALSDRLTEGITEDGLDDATEGIETNVSF
jgi:hypothetical protein